MAGSDGSSAAAAGQHDLLRKATQAMMSRYVGTSWEYFHIRRRSAEYCKGQTSRTKSLSSSMKAAAVHQKAQCMVYFFFDCCPTYSAARVFPFHLGKNKFWLSFLCFPWERVCPILAFGRALCSTSLPEGKLPPK